MITEPIARVKAEVFKQFPTTHSGGDYVVKKIKGTNTWSQHSWGNALDIMVPDLRTGDKVASWLTINRARFGTGTMLWRVKDHYDHVHIEGLPKMTGNPPAAGGRQPAPSPGASPGSALGNLGSNNPFIPDVIETPYDVAQLGVGLILSADTWIRVGLFLGGAALLYGGIIIFAREFAVPAVIKEVGDLLPTKALASTIASTVQ